MKDFLESVASKFPNQNSGNCVIANMHALPTIGELFKVALNKGFLPTDILFIGKPYSTVDATKIDLTEMGITFASLPQKFPAGHLVPLHLELLKKQLLNWGSSKGSQSFFLLDSGGYLTKTFDLLFPTFKRTSIQLTSSGSRMMSANANQLIDIGGMKAKKHGESAFIAEAICKEIEGEIGPLKTRKVCVIGKGAIGHSLIQLLIHKKIAHDWATGLENPTTFLNDYNVIISATGYDISALATALSTNAKHVDLFSCSSWDIEFRQLLLGTNAEVNLKPENQGSIQFDERITIHNGGCPVNFNRKSEMESESGIAITRGLALAALLAPKIDSEAIRNIRQAHRMHYNSVPRRNI